MLSLYLYAQENSQPEKGKDRAHFELIVEGITEKTGEVRIAMFNSESTYSEKENPLHTVVLPADTSKISWEDKELPFGVYAIAVYHDKNINEMLDTNVLGIPKEAYGFSNNARGRFGPASWNDAKFVVDSVEYATKITIK